MLGVMDTLENIGLIMLLGWFLFGPALLIGFSNSVSGRRKWFWLTVGLAPFILSVCGAYLAIVMLPQFPFHLHSPHFPVAFFSALFGAWRVYVFFRRSCTQSMTPNPTIERDAPQAGRPSL